MCVCVCVWIETHFHIVFHSGPAVVMETAEKDQQHLFCLFSSLGSLLESSDQQHIDHYQVLIVRTSQLSSPRLLLSE